MNRRTYMWKVGGLAVVMVAVVIWLFGCSRESIEEVLEGGPLSAPKIAIAVSSLDSLPTSTTIYLSDGSEYYIELTDPAPLAPSNEWCYYVEQKSGHGLSHWMLLIGCLVDPPGEDHILSSSPPGSEGYDGSTGQYGIKWDDLPVGFTSGTFCITLDGTYPPTIIDVLVKASSEYNTGSIAGPDCGIQHDQGGGGG